jgi:hypothetical protein
MTRVERRREARTAARGACALMRPGQRLVVVDVSANGALVEGGRPLRPGSDIEVQLERDVRGGMIAAHVMRCSVAALHGESGITYRAALAFHGACDWVREIRTPQGYRLPSGHSVKTTARDERGAHLPAMSGFAEMTENGELND